MKNFAMKKVLLFFLMVFVVASLEKKCKRRRKICQNGEKPKWKKNPRCSDGSKPSCPGKREVLEPDIKIMTKTPPPQLLNTATPVEFLTERHIDPFPDIAAGTASIEDTIEVMEDKFEKHVDPLAPLAIDPGTASNENLPVAPQGPKTPTIKHKDGLGMFPPLFTEKTDMDLSSIKQCGQGGVVACYAVRLITDLLSSLSKGSVVQLLGGLGFTMQLQKTTPSKEGKYYDFKIPRGRPSNILSVNEIAEGTEPSAFGNFKPSGSFIYFVESCGLNCTVILKRDYSSFGQD